MVLPLLIAAQISTGPLPAGQQTPSADFVASVLAPIHGLFRAFEAGDRDAMARLVYPEGRVTATGQRASGSELRQMSWTQFAQRVTPNSRFSESISDPAIKVDGDVAMVWAPFVVRVNGKVANCGIDHFDLTRENGAWKVMNLTFSSRTTECPAE